ncbi:hypothetical protein V1279_007152 [Bradyrhizobium sp. AZCC 1610]|uniref:hypothetical protein n=1 Tax=Bradyrhizobium sp. AZCC 1610 TaxID=3117020 RepID=UPI002FF065E9
MNVVEFPIADRPITESQMDKLHSQAFRDLESRICDCVSMAKIAAQAVMNIRTDDRELVFAVAHASEMLDTLKADYYAAYHGKKPLEP